MLEKSEVSNLLQNFCTMAAKQFGHDVKVVRTDNGSKFMVLKSFFQKNGIQHQTSCVDTPQQNGRVERKHRHILNIARACLFQGRLTVDFWGESIMTAAHIINRTPSPLLDGKTPYEVLHGKPPAYDLLRVFGCLCFAHRRGLDKDKFGDRSRKCIFVGYPFGTKGWRLFDIDRNEFFVSRDVIFFEDKFPGIDDTSYVSPPILQVNEPGDEWLEPVLDSRGSTQSLSMDPAPHTDPVPLTANTEPSTNPLSSPDMFSPAETPLPSEPMPPAPISVSPVAPTSPSVSPVAPTSTSVSPVASTSTDTALQDVPSPGLLEVLGRGHRTKKPSILLTITIESVPRNTLRPSETHGSMER